MTICEPKIEPSCTEAGAPLSVLVVFGSVRRDTVGIGLARALVRSVEGRGHRALLADPAQLRLPLIDRMYKEHAQGIAPEPMRQLATMIRESDAVIVVSAEYNHAPPPALMNLLDHYLEEWFGRPAGISTYSVGRFGGVRALSTLRMMLAELGMPTMPTILPVPTVSNAVTREGEITDAPLVQAIERFLSELEWWAQAARDRRVSVAYTS